MKYDIFISYRREGGDELARLIYDRLTARGYRVFFDIESLRSGEFNKQLLAVIEECRDMIVVLPPGALERCSNEGDWLYLELEHAMKNRKNIIPVMMKGFEWPETLPKGLEGLQNYNGIQDSKDYFDAVIDKLTTLLISRPVLFGFFQSKKKKKTSLSDLALKRLKRGASILAAIVLAVAAIIFISGAVRKNQLQEAAEHVEITLTPDEEMSTAEYHDAQEIVKKRLDILADGVEYDFAAKTDFIEISMPLEIFEGLDVKAVLEGDIARANNLFISGFFDTNGENFYKRFDEPVPVTTADIKKLSIKEASADELGVTEAAAAYYGLEAKNEYKYLEITLSEQVCQSMREVYGEHKTFYLGQDADEFDTYYWYPLFRSDEENTFYIINPWQSDKINELLLYNYLNESFSGNFSLNYTMPVEWKSLSDFEEPGEYQCNVWKIQEPYATLQLDTDSEEIAEGEQEDVISSICRRMDTLDMPYAIGKTVSPDSEYGITIRTGIEHMNPEIMEMILSTEGIYVEGAYYQLIERYDIVDLNYELQADGTYRFYPVIDPEWRERAADNYETAVNAMSSSESREVYLSLMNTFKVANADICEAVQDNKVFFDNLYFFNLENVTEENKYLLDLLKELAVNPDFSFGYTPYSLTSYIVTGAADKEWGIQSCVDEKLEHIQNKVTELYPGADVAYGYHSVDDVEISIDLNLNEEFPEKANEAIKQIYKISGLESGEVDSIVIECYVDDIRSIRISIRNNNIQNRIEYSGYCKFGWEDMQIYGEEFREIVLSDPFYTETLYSYFLEDEQMASWEFNFEGSGLGEKNEE